MRIVMLTSSYPVPGDPGWAPFIRDHARALGRRGHQVTVITPSLKHGLQTFKDSEGIRVVAYPYAPGFSPMLHCDQGLIPSLRRSKLARMQLPGFLLASMYYLILTARRVQADAIHAHWFLPAGLSAALVKPVLNLPLVTHGHGAEFHLPNRPLVRRTLAYVQSRSDVSLVPSLYLRGRAERYGFVAANIQVAAYGVDTSAFSPADRRENGNFVIGVARRLVPEKRIEDVILAMAALPSIERNRLSLRIAGTGQERGRLERLALAQGLGGRVRFLGRLPHSEMPGFLRTLDIFVNPSTQEGLSIANLEALACGVPVIAGLSVGNDEAIRDGRTGILVDTGDAHALRDVICRAMRFPARLVRMRTAARQDIVERFSLEQAACRWEGAYRQAVDRHRMS